MPQPPLNSWDLERIAELLLEAGDTALRHYDDPESTLKSDLTPVTAADRAAEQLFAAVCDRPADGVRMIGEETVSEHGEEYLQMAIRSERCFVVDPIDGTAPYTAHLPLWGISVGFMEDGVLREGAVYLPALDECLATSQGRILRRHLRTESVWHDFTPSRAVLSPAGHIAVGQRMAHHFVFMCSNQLFAWSSAVASLYWVLTGRVMAYFGDFKLWDVAGMLPILNLAGFKTVRIGAEWKELSLDLADGDFVLDAGTPARWRVAGPVIAAASPDIIEFIRQNSRDSRKDEQI